MVSRYLKEILLNAGLPLKFVLVNVCDLDKCENRFSFPCKGPGNVNLALGECLSSGPPRRLQLLIPPLVNGAENCCLPNFLLFDPDHFLLCWGRGAPCRKKGKDYWGRRNICIRAAYHLLLPFPSVLDRSGSHALCFFSSSFVVSLLVL